jgi:hypothetical protein
LIPQAHDPNSDQGGNMKPRAHLPKLHIITNPKQRDVLIGESDSSTEPETADVIPIALHSSYLAHPSQS